MKYYLMLNLHIQASLLGVQSLSRKLPDDTANIKNSIQNLNVRLDSLEKSFKTTNSATELKEEMKKLLGTFEILKSTAKENAKREMTILADMTIKLDEPTTLVSEKRSMQENEDICSCNKLKTTCNLHLPLNDMDSFQEFEENLKNPSESISNDLVNYFILNIFIKIILIYT